jgi:hypothetical protein
MKQEDLFGMSETRCIFRDKKTWEELANSQLLEFGTSLQVTKELAQPNHTTINMAINVDSDSDAFIYLSKLFFEQNKSLQSCIQLFWKDASGSHRKAIVHEFYVHSISFDNTNHKSCENRICNIQILSTDMDYL